MAKKSSHFVRSFSGFARKSQSKTQLSVFALALLLSISFAYLASAAPSQTTASWSDSFTDQTGIAALSNLNFSTGNLSLNNSPWYYKDHEYRKQITINGSTAEQANYQVLVNLTNRSLSSDNFDFSKANAQGNDTRFTWLNTSSGLEQNISFWIENWTSSGSLGNASIWVKVPNVTASTVANTTVYMYYGNPSATYNNSVGGNNTFEFFDDFSGDLSKWTITGNPVLDTGRLKLVGTGINHETDKALSIATVTRPAILEWQQQQATTGQEEFVGYGDVAYETFYFNLNPTWNTRAMYLNDNTGSRTDTQNTNIETYRINILPTSGYTAYINNVQTGTTISGTETSKKIRFSAYSGTYFVDNIRVRKYASPEPSVLSVGAEQNNTLCSGITAEQARTGYSITGCAGNITPISLYGVLETSDARLTTPRLRQWNVTWATPPAVALNSPADNAWSGTRAPAFTFTATDGGAGLKNCSLRTNEGGGWTADWNTSAITNGSQASITRAFSSDGTYIWNMECYDSLGNKGTASANRTVKVDTTNNFAAGIAANPPTAAGIVQAGAANQLLNFSISNTDANQNITQANITMPSGFNFILNSNGTSTSSTNFSNTTTIAAWSNTTASGTIANGATQYFWLNASVPTTPANYSFNVTTLDTMGVLNSTLVNVSVKGITLTESLSSTVVNPSDSVTVSGQATLQPDGTNVANNSINIYLDGQPGNWTPAGESQALWPYRKAITINGSTTEQANYQVNLLLNSSNVGGNFNWSTYGNDTRFTWLNTTSNSEQNISFWIEYWNNATAGNNASIWVKVPNVTASSVANTTLYMYYGNPSATYNNSLGGNNTFTFFDDFSGDLSKWINNYPAAYIIDVGRLKIMAATAGMNLNDFYSIATFNPNNYAQDYDVMISGSDPTPGGATMVGWRIDGTGNNVIYNAIQSDTPSGYGTVVSGGVTYSFNTPIILRDIWYKSGLKIAGTTLTIVFNSASYSGTDPKVNNFNSGNIGFSRWNNPPQVSYIDNVRVRKYASPEPSVLSVGAEQTNTTTTTTNSTGGYSYSFTAPATAGTHTVKINLMDANGIVGENTTTLSVRINLLSPQAKGTTTGNANVNVNESVNISVNIPASNINYPTLNLSKVWANVSNSTWSQIYFLSGNVSGGIWWNATFSSTTLGQYNVTFYANMTDGFSTTTAANATFNVKQLNITYSLNDAAIYATESAIVNGTVYREPEHGASVGTSVQGAVSSGNLTGDFKPAGETSFAWKYKKPITINGSTSLLNDYQILVNLTSSNFNFSRANSQGNDTRFTWLNTSSGLEQNVSFWIENWTASGSLGNATVWIKVPNVTASSVANTTLYLYYGNPSATYNNSLGGNNTFVFFDDFENGLGKWTIQQGTWTTASLGGSTALKLTSNNPHDSIVANIGISDNYVIESKIYTPSIYGVGLLFRGSNLNNFLSAFFHTNDYLSIGQQISGVWSNIGGGTTGVPIDVNTWYDFKLVVNGTNVSNYLLGYSNAQTTSQLQTNTKVGMWAWDGLNTYWDNYRVRKYASPEPSVLSVGAEQTVTTTTNSAGGYSFTYTPNASITSITSVNFTLNATDTDGITNTTRSPQGAITVYPQIAVDGWASTTSACSNRISDFNNSGATYLCANVTYGSVASIGGENVTFSVYKNGINNEGAANPVLNVTNTTTGYFKPAGESSFAWSYRKPITINGSASALTDYQVLVNLTSSNFDFSRANSQGNDTRFTWLNTSSGLEQNVPFWIENWTASGSQGNATLWVKVPVIPNSTTQNTTLYMYYGNAQATYNNTLGGSNTFEFFDDFNRADSADIGIGWTEYGSDVFEIRNSTAHRKAGAVATVNQMALATSLGSVTDIIVESKIYIVDTYDASSAHLGITARSNTATGSTDHRGYSLVTANAVTALGLLDEQVVWKASTTSTQALSEWWSWKLQVDGNNMRGKGWKAGTNEPSSWSVQDTSTTQASGYVGLDSTMYDIEAYWDDFRVRKYASPEPNVLSVGSQETQLLGVAYTSFTPNESSQYSLNVTAWNANINPSVTAADSHTFDFGQLNISSVNYDTTIYTTETAVVSGLVRDFMNTSWMNNATATNITISATSGTFNANSSFVNSTGGFNFTYAPNPALTTKTTATLNISATYGNITGNWTGTLNIYPAIQVNLTTNQSWYDIGSTINATATVFYGSSLDTSQAEVQFEVLKDGYRYPSNVTVNTSSWLATSGSTVSYQYTFNESGKYYVKATARNQQVNSAVNATAVKNYTAGRINTTINLNDTIIYSNENALVYGSVYDWLNSSWARNMTMVVLTNQSGTLSNLTPVTDSNGNYNSTYTPPSVTSIQTYTITANATDPDGLNSTTVSTQVKVYPPLNLTASKAWANATYYNKGEGIRFASALYANNSGVLQGAIARAYNPNFSASYIDLSERGETFWNGTYQGSYTIQNTDNSGNWSMGARLETNWETNLVNATVYVNPFKIGTGTYKDSLFTTPRQNFTQAETIHIKVENTAGNPSKINATVTIKDVLGNVASTQSVQDLAVGNVQDVSYALSDNNIGLDKQLKPGYWTATISANNTAGSWAYRAVPFFVAPDWWVADSTASAFWEYRQRIMLDNSLGIEQANVSVRFNGSQLNASGVNLSRLNIGSIRIIDMSQNGTGANEIGGMRLNYTTNASGTFGASDYIIFNASIPENSRKSYYLYYSENSMAAPSYGMFSGPFFPALLEQPTEPSALRVYNLVTSKGSYRFGETVYVNASVFSTHPAQTKINFYFLNSAGSIADDLTVYNVLDPNLDRIFESASALPLSSSYGGYGIWAVRADVYDWLISNITPQDTKSLNFTVDELRIPFTVSQAAFDAGTAITISGYGWRAANNETADGANYSIARDGAIINISTTNSTGNFSYTYTEKTPGAHTITVSMNKTIGSATILGENSTAINVRSRADIIIQSQDTNRNPDDSPTFLVNITRNYADVSQTVDLDFAINDTNGATGYSIARKTIIAGAESSNSTTVDWDIRNVLPQNYTIGVSANISGYVAGQNMTWFNRLNLTEALSMYNVNTFNNITLTGSVRYGPNGAVLNNEAVNITIAGPENYVYQVNSNPSNYNYTFSVGIHGNYSVSVVSAGAQYKGYNTTNFTVNYTTNLTLATDISTLMANRNLTINITTRNNDNASVSGLQANITLLNSTGTEIRSLANITQNFGALENKTNQTWWLTAGASEGIYYVRARAYYEGRLAGERNYTLNITNYTANVTIATPVSAMMANRNLTINITTGNTDDVAATGGVQTNVTILNLTGSEILSIANFTNSFAALQNKTNTTAWLTAGYQEGTYYIKAKAYFEGALVGEATKTITLTNYTANVSVALNASTIKANRVLAINITTENGDTVPTAGLQTNLTLLDAAGSSLASLLNVTQDYTARENRTNSTSWATTTTAPGTYYVRARAYLGGALVGEANQSFQINDTRNITQSVSTNASSYSGVGKSVGISAWVNRTGNVLINGTADIYIISYGGTRYEAELNDSGTWTTGTLNFTGILAQPVQARWNTENFHNGTYFAYLAFNYTDEYGNNLSLTANNTFNISPQWSATFAYVYPTITAYNWSDTFANVTIRLNNTGNTELCDDPVECEFFVKATAVNDSGRFKVFTVQTAPHDAGWTGIAGPVAILATLDKSAYVTNFVFSGDPSTWLAGNYTFNTTLHYDGARTADNLTYGFRILETYGNLTLAAGAGSNVNNKNFTSNSDLTFNTDWSTAGANTDRQLTGWADIKYKGFPELLAQAAQNFTATSGGTPNNIIWNSGQMPAAEYDVYLWASAIGSNAPVDFVYSTTPGYIPSYKRAFRISSTKDARIISISADRSSNYSLNENVTISGTLWRRGNINFTGTLDINITGPSDALNMSSCDMSMNINNSVNASFSCIWNTSVYPAGAYNASALIIWGTDPLNRSANWTAFSITPVKSAAVALSTEASSYSMNQNISSSVNVTGTGNADITGNLTLALTGTENKTPYSENAINVSVSAAAARSIPWNTTNTLAGNYVLNATYAYYNANGNLTVASAAKSITIASDTNATARIFTDKQAYINSENANISFNFTAEGNNEYPGAAYAVALNGSAGTIASSSWASLARNGTNHSAVIWNTASRPAGTYFVSLTVTNSSKTWSANTTFAIQEIKSARISGLAVDRIIPSYYNIGESIAIQGGTLSAAGNVNLSGNLTVKFTDKRTLATYNTTTCKGIATPYSISSCTGSSLGTAGWSVGRVYMNASFAYDNSSGQQLAVNATELQIGSTSVNATARGNDNVPKTDFFKKDSVKIYLKIRNTSGDTVSGIAAGNASSVTKNGVDITSAARSGWTDAGGGEYYFTLGELALGTYAVTATVQDPYEGTSGTGSVTFVVSEHWVIFTVSSGGMSPVSDTAKKYAASDMSGSTSTAVISRGSLKNVTGASGAIAVNQWLQDNNIYLVFTKGTYANIESRLSEIESGEFEKYASPSFGFPLKKDYTLSVGIDYSPKDINLLGDMQLYPGMYTFVIRNEGVQNGKTVVSVNRK